MSKKQGSRSRTCPTPPKTSAGRRGPCDAWFRLSWSRGRSTWIRSIQAFARWTSNGKLVLHGNIKHQFWILGRVFLVSDTAVPHSAKIFFCGKTTVPRESNEYRVRSKCGNAKGVAPRVKTGSGWRAMPVNQLMHQTQCAVRSLQRAASDWK